MRVLCLWEGKCAKCLLTRRVHCDGRKCYFPRFSCALVSRYMVGFHVSVPLELDWAIQIVLANELGAGMTCHFK